MGIGILPLECTNYKGIPFNCFSLSLRTVFIVKENKVLNNKTTSATDSLLNIHVGWWAGAKNNINCTATNVGMSGTWWGSCCYKRGGGGGWRPAEGCGVQTDWGHKNVTAGPRRSSVQQKHIRQTCYPENTLRVYLLPGIARAQRDCGKRLLQHAEKMSRVDGVLDVVNKWKAWKYQGHLQQSIWHFTVLSSSLMHSGLLRFAGIAKLPGLRMHFTYFIYFNFCIIKAT